MTLLTFIAYAAFLSVTARAASSAIKIDQKETIRIYKLSHPVIIDPPPAPMCHVKINGTAQAMSVNLTMWKSSPDIPITDAVMVVKYKYLTTCVRGFWGGMEKKMEKRYALKIMPHDLIFPSLDSMTLNEFIDMTAEPAYDCKWWSTETKFTERVMIKRVHVYLADKGHLVADNVNWGPTPDSKIWTHGAWILSLASPKVDHCPYQPFKTAEGILFNATHNSQIFLGNKDHIRLVIDLNKRPVICKDMLTDLYPTDMGIPISISSSHHRSTSTALGVNWETREVNTALFESEVLFELHHLAQSVNSNFETLDLHLCLGKRAAWSQAVRSNDANLLAVYVSHDPFAVGLFHHGKFEMRFREPMDWEVTIDQIHLEDGNKIRLTRGSSIHSVEPASGIIDSPYNTTPSMPPLLELARGGYFNLRSQTRYQTDSESWVHSKILIDDLNITNYDTVHSTDDEVSSVPHPESTKLISAWETWMIKIPLFAFGISVVVLVIWMSWAFRELIKALICHSNRSPDVSLHSESEGSLGAPEIVPNLIHLQGGRRNIVRRRPAQVQRGRIARPVRRRPIHAPVPAPRARGAVNPNQGWYRNYILGQQRD